MYYNPLFLQTPSWRLTAFYETDLGKLYQTIPFKELAAKIPATAQLKSGRGRKAFLTIEGGIALMILKHYLGLSDEMLIERLNTDWSMQCFCGIYLEHKKIKDKNLVSWWRCFFGEHLNIDRLQGVFIEKWKPFLEQTHVTMMDATAYESNIRYPTDVKLIWESITKLYSIQEKKRKGMKLRRSRSNYKKHEKSYLDYQRSRRKSKRKEKKLRKQLLKYLFRSLNGLKAFNALHKLKLSSKETTLIKNIETIYEQQHELLYGDRDKVKQRVVSLSKPYVRSIVRGKEVKPVEFGAKVHKVQVSGISFIEHLSYENFNEGTRLKKTIAFHQKHFGKCHQLGADAIYATNANRKYCNRLKIATCFLPKGRQGKLEDQKAALRSAISLHRGTILEGSFGNEKQHYLLNKIKARTQKTEMVWIFFGMMTANASIMIKRMLAKPQLKRSA